MTATPKIELVEGVDYGTTVYAPPQAVPYAVLYNGVTRRVWVVDRGIRPPDVGGVWLDDLLSEACRRAFGCKVGEVRVDASTRQPEFRAVWLTPNPGKVVAKVPLDCRDESGRLFRKEVVAVSCRAVPGADQDSVIAAEVYAICKRRLGAGTLTQSLSKFEYRQLPLGAESVEVPYSCRYTVMRAGVAHDVMVKLPPKLGGEWKAAVAAVTKEGADRFGAGTLKYAPELGATYFTLE